MMPNRRRALGALFSIRDQLAAFVIAGVPTSDAPAAAAAPSSRNFLRETVSISTFRVMDLDEPEPLVDAARDLGEDVRGAGVLKVVHLFDGEARPATELRENIRQRRDVLVARRPCARI